MGRDLLLYNTASRSKQLFEPRNGGPVTMYCCGPTVYDFAHIGNFRTYLWEDVLKRLLTELGYHVRHVTNITDVGHLTSDEDSGEDKMEKGARREGKTAWEVAEFYTQAFLQDFRSLNCIEPDVWCRATGHIPEMIALVKALEDKGFTYRTSDGVYFDTSKFPAYSEFARLDPDSLQAGARIDMGEKRNPTDFALWKLSGQGAKRQMEWQSPWGTGFPGWHIECSAMSAKYLGQPIDIHCGGQEHVRVHHTNEIAQSEAATGMQLARFWLHGEWLMFASGKMSKSTGGVTLLSDIKNAGVSPLAYRFFAFSAHHRSPVNFSWDGLNGAAQGLKNLRRQAAELKQDAGSARTADQGAVDHALDAFMTAMCDDLNIPQAVAAVWELLRDKEIASAVKVAAIESADRVLGLRIFQQEESPARTLEIEVGGLRVRLISNAPIHQSEAEHIGGLIARRKAARASKDFVTADAIRDELAKRRVSVKDLADGTTDCVVG